MRILLIEDDSLLAAGVRQALANDGHVVEHLPGIRGAASLIADGAFDIILLDLGLPDGDGMSLLQALRKKENAIPVLILTARDAIEDRVKGLDSGADDYLVKPFAIDELKARLRVLGRRREGRATDDLTVGNVTLYPSSMDVAINGEHIALPRREFVLLQKLMENAGRVVTRDQAEEALYNLDKDVSSNALEVHIHHLRKKLGSRFIRTVRGVGYMVDKAP